MNNQKFLTLSDTPFTLIIPKLNFDTAKLDKIQIAELVFEHVLPGVQMKGLRNGETFGNLNHNAVSIKNSSPERWTVNDVNVLNFNNLPSKLISYIEIDGYLKDHKNNFAKRNIQEHNR